MTFGRPEQLWSPSWLALSGGSGSPEGLCNWVHQGLIFSQTVLLDLGRASAVSEVPLAEGAEHKNLAAGWETKGGGAAVRRMHCSFILGDVLCLAS